MSAHFCGSLMVQSATVPAFVRLLEKSRDVAVERRDSGQIVLRKAR